MCSAPRPRLFESLLRLAPEPLTVADNSPLAPPALARAPGQDRRENAIVQPRGRVPLPARGRGWQKTSIYCNPERDIFAGRFPSSSRHNAIGRGNFHERPLKNLADHLSTRGHWLVVPEVVV